MKEAVRTAGLLILAALAFLAAWHLLQGGGESPAEVVPEAAVVEESVPEPVTPPLSFAGFEAGEIIADEVFYNSGAMSEQQVEDFLQEVNYGCREGGDGTPCLGNYREDTVTIPADNYCFEFEGGQDRSAAQIIHEAAISCGVNPQVLLVMLQKEQGLLTASGARLNADRYAIAMGYGCPDTANCDPQFFGFGKQTYYAARQLRRYANEPGEYRIVPGVVNEVRFHPSSSCGTEPVLISNYATAGLYNYTPYQPNVAALEGNANDCSSVGNLYFYAYFNAWFGAE